MACSKLFLFGESWSGLTIPALSHSILSDPYFPCEISGVGIGDGLTDPAVQIAHHASFGFATGLINGPQRDRLEAMQAEIVGLINSGQLLKASGTVHLLFSSLLPASSIVFSIIFQYES